MGLNLCKYSLHCCCYCFLCKCCYGKPQNSVGIVQDKKLKFLLLGLSGSGKTEIAHYLSKAQRQDYTATNGVHTYSFRTMQTMCSVTEIGGSADMQRIWHHYFVGTMGVIFCFDMSSQYEDLKAAFRTLQNLIKSPYIKAKPILLVGTKADLADEGLQLYDIENEFHVAKMALSYGSKVKLCCYDPRTTQLEENINTNLRAGLQWMVAHVLENYNVIQKRLSCDKNTQMWEQQRNKLVAEGKISLNSYSRSPKTSRRHKFWGLSHKPFRRSLVRPWTAPPKIVYIATIEQTTAALKDGSSPKTTNYSSFKVPNGEPF